MKKNIEYQTWVKVLWNSIVGLDRYRMNSTTHYSYLNVPLAYDYNPQNEAFRLFRTNRIIS